MWAINPVPSRGSYLLVWKRWSGSVRWQEDSWQPKSLMSRQPGSSLGQVPTPRGGPRSGKGSSGVRNFSYEVVADVSSDMAGDGRARATSLIPGCSQVRPRPHSKLSAFAAAPGCARRSSPAAWRPAAAPGVRRCAKRRLQATTLWPPNRSPRGFRSRLSRRRCCDPAQPRQRSAAAARPAHCARRPSPPSAGRDWKGSRKPLPAPPAGAEEERNLRKPHRSRSRSCTAHPALPVANQGFRALKGPAVQAHPLLRLAPAATGLRKGTWPR